MSRSINVVKSTLRGLTPTTKCSPVLNSHSRPFSQTCIARKDDVAGQIFQSLGSTPKPRSTSTTSLFGRNRGSGSNNNDKANSNNSTTTTTSITSSVGIPNTSTGDLSDILNLSLNGNELLGLRNDNLGNVLAEGNRNAYDTEENESEPHHIHVYAHKHNTHVTVTKPNRDVILSMSCGKIGFRNSRRKHYDAAYQLMVEVLTRLTRTIWTEPQLIPKLEVVLRGFGQGREAASKVLLSTEGAPFRRQIVRVADSTKLKFGGTRSPNPRRLG